VMDGRTVARYYVTHGTFWQDMLSVVPAWVEVGSPTRTGSFVSSFVSFAEPAACLLAASCCKRRLCGEKPRAAPAARAGGGGR
jgi:hypothetical protein